MPRGCGISSSSSSLRNACGLRRLNHSGSPIIVTPAALSGAPGSTASAAKLYDHADGAPPALRLVDGQNIFKRQRLKVEAITGVIVGGDSLRVAVDHDGLSTVISQRERRVATAVIQTHSGQCGSAAAQDDDLSSPWRRFIFFFVSWNKDTVVTFNSAAHVSTACRPDARISSRKRDVCTPALIESAMRSSRCHALGSRSNLARCLRRCLPAPVPATRSFHLVEKQDRCWSSCAALSRSSLVHA